MRIRVRHCQPVFKLEWLILRDGPAANSERE